MLNQISIKEVQRINSGQVIVDLRSCCKELIENSIDAHSTSIEIIVKEYGTVSIECVDNGDGVPIEDHSEICLNHYTSKLSSFEDLDQLETLGFRGELLSSLCNISDVSISTSTGGIGYSLKYNHQGALVSSSKISRNKGTTIQIQNLFDKLPVRRKNFINNSRKEFVKLISLIQQYCIFLNLRISLVHHVNGKKRQILFTNGSESMIDNIREIFDNNFIKTLSPIKIKSEKFELNGYISNFAFGQGRNINDRQSVAINQRPVKLPKLNRLITEVYKNFNHLEIPSFFINLTIETNELDVNVTPDKMTVFINKEFEILEIIRLELVQFFESQNNLVPKNFISNVEEKRPLPVSILETPELKKRKLKSSDVFNKSVAIQVENWEPKLPKQSSQQEIDSEAFELSDLKQIAISKNQFAQMNIIGQFNLGFIIVSITLNSKLNIFIIDQHASDEKFNFENICLSKVPLQKLISPVSLNLNSHDKLIVQDNLKIFERNGFQLNESLELLTIPNFYRRNFNTDDFQELIHLINANPHNSEIKPSKFYQVFASRACRTSIMIGDHLTHPQMSKIVKNLSEIDKPWNCPHGRPTMRHLIELNSTGFQNDYL